MRNVVVAFVVLVTLAFAGNGGGGIAVGYQFANSEAAKNAAESMGLEVSNSNALTLDFWGYGISSPIFRMTGFLGGQYFDAKGQPDPEKINEDESGVGYGVVSLGVMPEIYMNFGPLNVAGGVGAGGGAIITYINDSNGDNDGLYSFYYFVRPQITGVFKLGESMGIQLALGYDMPLGGGDGEYWFLSTAGDTVRYTFKPDEIGGLYLKAGLVFGGFEYKEE